MAIIDHHPTGDHPLSVSLQASEVTTQTGVDHRELMENGNTDALLRYIVPAIQKHHISPDAMKRRHDLIATMKFANSPGYQSPYPQDLTTQKGNFAEIFLAEYLEATSEMQLPVYRLRYNTNPNQSMKGDDVLLFDLDADPVRIIVGESKYRGVPDKQSVIDMVDGLMRSNKAGLPISLMFVADRLFEENKIELGEKVQNCVVLFALNRLHVDYVGLLMSNHNAKNPVNKHTENKLHNLLMISLGIQSPEAIVKQAFGQLEGSV